MSETSVKIIKNEIRCRDDTMPKTVDTRSHCKVRLRACNNLPQPPPYISVFWGCGRLLHALNLTLQWLLVSTVFGMVSSLHLISFLMIFTLVYIRLPLPRACAHFLACTKVLAFSPCTMDSVRRNPAAIFLWITCFILIQIRFTISQTTAIPVHDDV